LFLLFREAIAVYSDDYKGHVKVEVNVNLKKSLYRPGQTLRIPGS
jgi:hypothetical protein